MFAGAKVSGAVILAWLLLSVPRSEGAESIRQQFDKIAEVALQKTGLDQIREINLSINTLLNTTHFFLKSPETDHWRLRRVGIKSERILVVVRSSNELHVVLEIHYGDREIILDNRRNVMVTMEDLRDAYEIYGGAP
jgi:predicted transglutaminase-like cysteine proteinase